MTIGYLTIHLNPYTIIHKNTSERSLGYKRHMKREPKEKTSRQRILEAACTRLSTTGITGRQPAK
jgi:hypothetical protein